MTNKTMLGSLVLAASLLSGSSLAANTHMEPTPEKELPPIENKEAEITEARLDLALRDTDVSAEEQEGKDDFRSEFPILMDGKLYSAEELREAGIFPQHYALDSRSAEMKVIQAFRSTDSFREYLEKTGQMPEEKPAERAWLCKFFPGQFYEHDFYGGARFSVPAGQALSSLGGFWNDRISSLWASPCSSWTVLFEHDNFGGHPLWVARGWALPFLWNKGFLTFPHWWSPRWNTWNDRASSIISFY